MTAKERQREREEKRKRRQERAKEREKQKKEKEKERKDMLTENDRNLLERWTKMVDRTQNKPAQNGSAVPSQATAPSHMLPQVPSANPLPPQVPPASHIPPTSSANVSAPTDFLTFSDKVVPALRPKLTLVPVGAELAPVQGSNANVVHFFPAQTAPFLVTAPACQKAAPSKPECLLSVKYGPSQIFQASYGVTTLGAWSGVPQPENWAVAGQLPVNQPEIVPPNDTLPEQPVTFGVRGGVEEAMFLTELGKAEGQSQGLVAEETQGPDRPQMASGLSPETTVPSEPPDINMVTQQLSKSQVIHLYTKICISNPCVC